MVKDRPRGLARGDEGGSRLLWPRDYQIAMRAAYRLLVREAGVAVDRDFALAVLRTVMVP